MTDGLQMGVFRHHPSSKFHFLWLCLHSTADAAFRFGFVSFTEHAAAVDAVEKLNGVDPVTLQKPEPVAAAAGTTPFHHFLREIKGRGYGLRKLFLYMAANLARQSLR